MLRKQKRSGLGKDWEQLYGDKGNDQLNFNQKLKVWQTKLEMICGYLEILLFLEKL